MPRSIWRINISSEKEDNAKKVLNSIIKTIGRPPVESKIEKYSKGGHMATMQFYHSDNLSWPEVVYEVTTVPLTFTAIPSDYGCIVYA